ncbi:hypothetical protein [Pseudonocardia sp. HH130629-09]|uniref:hypothetical protein n=1 Tax=Pseudonocardia sp. HH130629-09 TaxID=1641402 RepID=UPI000B12C900|nr:hypothetical protein [Pseudonocardia sp. HH130629-09]
MTVPRRRTRPAGPRLLLAGAVLVLTLAGPGVAGPAAAGTGCSAAWTTAGCR